MRIKAEGNQYDRGIRALMIPIFDISLDFLLINPCIFLLDITRSNSEASILLDVQAPRPDFNYLTQHLAGASTQVA
jgi:hypothetical protein